jgi:E3 ubiquitin-protein ligase synoviolin
MVSFKHYCLFSLISLITAFWYTFATRKQFYISCIYLSTNKLNLIILSNFAFFLLVLLGKLFIKLFFNQLTRDESEELLTLCKYTITENCLALTIFREELNNKILVYFILLLFIKIFHWLLQLRIENLQRNIETNWRIHIKIVINLIILGSIDLLIVISLTQQFLATKHASVNILFLFEYSILFLLILLNLFRYILVQIDINMHQNRWANKSIYLFYLEFTNDILRLFLYLVFFLLVCYYYGLPLHLIRELFLTAHSIRDRILKFIKFRRITANMNSQFPNSTAQELAAIDNICIVCREEMTVGQTKKLPQCNHHFHTACLRSWLERQQSCPTCRAQINVVNNPQPQPQQNQAAAAQQQQRQQQQQQQQQQAQVNGAVPVAGVGASPANNAGATAGTHPAAADGSLPPLPPHLQEFLNQQARAKQQQQAATSNAAQSPSEVKSAQNPPSHTNQSSNILPLGLNNNIAMQAAIPTALPMFAPPMFGAPPALGSNFIPFMNSYAAGGMPLFPQLPQLNTDNNAVLDEYNVAILEHSTMLMNHYMEFLQSQLNQVKGLFEKQIALQNQIREAQINKLNKQSSGTAAERVGNESKQVEEKIVEHDSIATADKKESDGNININQTIPD